MRHKVKRLKNTKSIINGKIVDVEVGETVEILSTDTEAFVADGEFEFIEAVKEMKKEDFDEMTIPALKKYAEKNNIDLGGATKKDEIIDVIMNPPEITGKPEKEESEEKQEQEAE